MTELQINNFNSKIKLNEEFETWEDFKSNLKIYEENKKVIFCISNSKLLSSHPIKNANDKCKYLLVKLTCKYSSKRHKYRGTAQRETRTIKQNCKAFITLTLTRDNHRLIIKSIDLEHTGHEGSEQFYKYLPENRKLQSEEDKDLVKSLLLLNCPKGRIRDEVLNKKGIYLTSKDLHNFNQNLKDKNEDQLSSLVDLLRNTYNASVDVFFENRDKLGKNVKRFQALLFSTEDMRKSLSSWPEVIFVDTTYNLLKRNLITLLMCVQDSNGFTHIVSVAILSNEEYATLKSVFNIFKNMNEEACKKTKCFLTDKDLNERTVLKEIFPNVELYICEFHVLKIFLRKVTTTSMKITAQERDTTLEILEKLAKSNSVEQYDVLYEKLCISAPKVVIDYFNKNWHATRQEWTRYSLSQNNYGNYTNNPVESANSQLKREISRHSTLVQFCYAFFRFHKRRNDTVKYKLGENIYKHPIRGYVKGTPEYLYQETLTPKAFKIVIMQYLRRKPMEFMKINEDTQTHWIQCGYTVLEVTIDECECNDYTSTKLPCRHIFSVREYYQLPLFDSNLYHLRWTKQYNLENQAVLQPVPVIQSSEMTKYITHETPKQKIESFSCRLKRMKEVVGNVAYCGSLVTKDRFQYRLDVLNKIEDAWRQNKEVDVNIKDNVLSELTTLSISDKPDDSINSSIIMPTPLKIRGQPKDITKSHTKSTYKK